MGLVRQIMPVVKVKELPAYHHLLEAVWQRKFNVSLAADKNLIEHRKTLRQDIARTFGLYAGSLIRSGSKTCSTACATPKSTRRTCSKRPSR
jgi:hypothetical protein